MTEACDPVSHEAGLRLLVIHGRRAVLTSADLMARMFGFVLELT